MAEEEIRLSNARLATVTGLQIGATVNKRQPGTQTYFMNLDWTFVPWWVRLLGLIRLPYDVVRFVVTGRLMVIPWPWRW